VPAIPNLEEPAVEGRENQANPLNKRVFEFRQDQTRLGLNPDQIPASGRISLGIPGSREILGKIPRFIYHNPFFSFSCMKNVSLEF